ncbi:hypothetical protein [Brachybacterium tyrofermentans]|uniref:hypothetical protein n=1 Tax=Brachybacterium tyrofermentans TaxID=47848 RepID=UPI003F91F947
MIPNDNPKLCATYDWTSQETSRRSRVYIPVIAWDSEGHALIPSIKGHLTRVDAPDASMGRFAGLNGFLSRLEPWGALQERVDAATQARRREHP